MAGWISQVLDKAMQMDGGCMQRFVNVRNHSEAVTV